MRPAITPRCVPSLTRPRTYARYLKPTGVMLPQSSKIFIAPVAIDDYYNERVRFWHDVYGVDMSCLTSWAKEEFFSHPMCALPFHLLVASHH